MKRSAIKRSVDRCVKRILSNNIAQKSELRLISHLIEKKNKQRKE